MCVPPRPTAARLGRRFAESSESFSRRSIRYFLLVLVTSKRSSNFLLYKRSEQGLRYRLLRASVADLLGWHLWGVSVCVCERERVCVCVCERESECATESVSERETESVRESVCERGFTQAPCSTSLQPSLRWLGLIWLVFASFSFLF